MKATTLFVIGVWFLGTSISFGVIKAYEKGRADVLDANAKWGDANKQGYEAGYRDAQDACLATQGSFLPPAPSTTQP